MKSSGYIDYLRDEVFRSVSGITFRSMFGGFGVYKDGQIFGLVDNDILYFKVGDSNRPDYEQLGSRPFSYSVKGKTHTMSYWAVPEHLLDDSDTIKLWLQKSLQVKKPS